MYNSCHENGFITAKGALNCFAHSFHLSGWGEVAWTTKNFE
jgi:hypothetical protein